MSVLVRRPRASRVDRILPPRVLLADWHREHVAVVVLLSSALLWCPRASQEVLLPNGSAPATTRQQSSGSTKKPNWAHHVSKDNPTSTLTDGDISCIAEVILQHIQATSSTGDPANIQPAADNDPDDVIEFTDFDVSGKIIIIVANGSACS